MSIEIVLFQCCFLNFICNIYIFLSGCVIHKIINIKRLKHLIHMKNKTNCQTSAPKFGLNQFDDEATLLTSAV